ncbi:MAG: hypothetical protein RR051_02185 [Clostridiales bacterium]
MAILSYNDHKQIAMGSKNFNFVSLFYRESKLSPILPLAGEKTHPAQVLPNATAEKRGNPGTDAAGWAQNPLMKKI